MSDDNRDKWRRLPKISFNRKALTKRMKKVESVTVKHAHKFIIKRWANVREVQAHVVLWIIAIGLLIAVTGLQLMWYQQSYHTDAPRTDGTYAEAVVGPVKTLNPIFADTSAEQSASNLMFSSLLRYDSTGHLGYDLVRDVKANPNKTIYTITIRPDAKWHDGYKLTAKDVVFTVNLIKNQNTRATIDGWGDVTAKVINDTTLEFDLKSTFAPFEHALTFPVLPEHILGKVSPSSVRENSFSQNPIGSGPFKLRFSQDVDTASGRKIIYLARNDDYYAGQAKLARFQLHVYADGESIIRALSLNEVNAAADLSSVDVEHVDSNKYNISSESIQSGVYAMLNTESETLKDVELRRALQQSTDTNQILSRLPSASVKLDLPFTNGQITGDLPKVPLYDKNAAAKILDGKGWKLNGKNVREKDGKPLKLSVVTIKDSELERVLELLVGNWRALGISVDTRVIDLTDSTQNAVQSVLQPRSFDVLLYRLNIGADPDVYAYWHSSQATPQGYNFSNYSSVISDAALVSARARAEPVLRNAKYVTFTKQWVADVPAIGLYQSTTQYASSYNAKAFNKSVVFVSPINRYADILDWSVGTKGVYKTP